MDKRILSFLALFLCLSVLVQHIQLQRERDNWRRLNVQLEVHRAHAFAPLSAVLAAPAGPVFLTGLVLGSGAYYCWSHGGKEAFLQVVQATKDGVAVTKDWVQKQIAELNGIDTSSSISDISDFISDPNEINSSGVNWELGQQLPGNSYSPSYRVRDIDSWITGPYGTFYPPYHKIEIHGQTPDGQIHSYKETIISDMTWFPSLSAYKGTRKHRYIGIEPSNDPFPNAFDPSDYPEFYTGPALQSNCHAVAQANPDLIYFTPDVATTTPPENSVPIHDPIYIAAVLPDGSTIDNKGNKYPPLPGAVWPGVLNPPGVAPETVGEIGTPTGTAVIPKTLADKLAELGIPEGAKITSVTPNSITWEHTNGTAVYTHAPAEVTAPLAQTVTNSTTSVISQAEAEADPGNPADVELPAVPTLDTDWAWGEMMDWDWDAWIAKIPFLNALSGSSLHLSSANSVINFPLNILGFSKVVNFDFADWEWVWNAMGALIYALAAWWALQLAILKNG